MLPTTATTDLEIGTPCYGSIDRAGCCLGLIALILTPLILTPLILTPLILTPAVASAQSLRAHARLGGGYDSNPTLATEPGSRRRPERGAAAVAGDGALAVGGAAELRIGEQWQGYVRFDLDGTVFGRGDALFWERLGGGVAVEVDVLTFGCSALGARLDSGVSFDSGWTGELACSVLARPAFGLWGSIEPRVAVRGYDLGQLDGLYGGRAELGWEQGPFWIAAGFDLLRRESDDRFSTRTELGPIVRARLAWDVAGAELRYQFVHREFEVSSRTGDEHLGAVRAWARPWPFLGAWAELLLGYADGKPQALAYERVEVMAGLSVHVDWQERRELAPSPDEQGPAVVEDDAVRFEISRPDAREVAVIGSFNDWDPERGRLTRREDGVFVGRFAIEPGHHTYLLLVDGEPARPEGAPRYVEDDFGGENAVLIVP